MFRWWRWWCLWTWSCSICIKKKLNKKWKRKGDFLFYLCVGSKIYPNHSITLGVSIQSQLTTHDIHSTDVKNEWLASIAMSSWLHRDKSSWPVRVISLLGMGWSLHRHAQEIDDFHAICLDHVAVYTAMICWYWHNSKTYMETNTFVLVHMSHLVI